MPEELITLGETMNQLKKKGFIEEFEIKDGGFINRSGEKFQPEDLTITKVYRFEGISDPDDMSVLYAIETSAGKKGIFVDGFGIYTSLDQNAAELLKRLKIIKDH